MPAPVRVGRLGPAHRLNTCEGTLLDQRAQQRPVGGVRAKQGDCALEPVAEQRDPPDPARPITNAVGPGQVVRRGRRVTGGDPVALLGVAHRPLAADELADQAAVGRVVVALPPLAASADAAAKRGGDATEALVAVVLDPVGRPVPAGCCRPARGSRAGGPGSGPATRSRTAPAPGRRRRRGAVLVGDGGDRAGQRGLQVGLVVGRAAWRCARRRAGRRTSGRPARSSGAGCWGRWRGPAATPPGRPRRPGPRCRPCQGAAWTPARPASRAAAPRCRRYWARASSCSLGGASGLLDTIRSGELVKVLPTTIENPWPSTARWSWWRLAGWVR
jgi:hypothetical protein